MSIGNASDWLLSQNSYCSPDSFSKKLDSCVTISVASGKGGVGKTSVSVKMAKELASNGYKVLLVDCDYNLSNTQIKLGLPINNNFDDLIQGKIDFEESVVSTMGFDLLAGCNGSQFFFENEVEIDKVVIEVMAKQEAKYDFIILDCPAGINKRSLAINAYSDYRFIVINPDKSSITDSYSLIKLLMLNFGIKDNHLILNKISGRAQFSKLNCDDLTQPFTQSCDMCRVSIWRYKAATVMLYNGLN